MGLLGVILAYAAVAALAFVIVLLPFGLVVLVLVGVGRLLGISFDGKRFFRPRR